MKKFQWLVHDTSGFYTEGAFCETRCRGTTNPILFQRLYPQSGDMENHGSDDNSQGHERERLSEKNHSERN